MKGCESTKEMHISYTKHECFETLQASDRELIERARDAAAGSFSPYSHFSVGAALRLQSGDILVGANVESEVFPQGMCAERTLLYHTSACRGSDVIEALAVSSISSGEECYPCGACRQTLLDTERRQGSPIRIIMAGSHSATIVESAAALLPFAFKL